VFSNFFINRPIFASVLSIVITLGGSIALFTLPVAQYPEITPPTVEVSAIYPGANAQVVADTVAAPIEQQVNGVENMLYMSSQCTNDGVYTLTVTFKIGVDLNMAQVLVQNRVALAEPILPDLVKRRGILVKKKSPSVLMIVNLFSTSGRGSLYLSNYATIQIRDELARLPGVGDITYLGQRDYSMRLWLDPRKMSTRGLSASDVTRAIEQQNVQVAAGQIGQPPVPRGQVFQYTMTTLGRLADAEQFASLILKSDPDGRLVRMRDVVQDDRYAFRLRLSPERLRTHQLSTADVVVALASQGVRLTTRRGRSGEPSRTDHTYRITVPAIEAPTSVEVGDLPVHKVHLRDLVVPDAGITREPNSDEVGVELGAQSYDQTCTMNGQASVALSIYQLPGSNALDVARQVRDKMKELKQKSFPEGVDYRIVYDTTPFITESINEVFHTLRDAVILVAVVVLLFLQNWRSAIIPLVAVPVAIVGTFAVMAAIGFSLNNLTLFGLVLAIGIVVDDAIVVVEAVEHHIEHGLAPKEATARAMEQVSGPVVAVGLVLSAVFVPCAFITGITGQFFRQFALTIAVSTIISAFNSLTLSPALSALLLKPRPHGQSSPSGEALPILAFVLLGGFLGYRFLGEETLAWWENAPPWAAWAVPVAAVGLGAAVGWLLARPLNFLLGGAFRLFNAGFNRSTDAYTRLVGLTLRLSVLVLLVYGGLLGLTWLGLTHTPTGFIPSQDKGYLLVNVQLPDGASVERTEEIIQKMNRIALGDEEHGGKYRGPKPPPGSKLYEPVAGVSDTVAVSGQSILLGANAPNFGAMYVMLDDFHERTRHGLSDEVIAARLRQRFQSEIADGLINVFPAPPVEGLGTAGGFKIVIQDRGDSGLGALQAVSARIVEAGNDTEELQGLFTSFRADTPWLDLDIDRTQAMSMGVSMSEVFNALQVYLGSLYVNDFNRFGRTWQVNVQATAWARQQVDNLRQVKLRNDQGQMVSLGTLCQVKPVSGPVMIVRYNMYPAAAINGAPAPGVSSGQAIELMQAVAQKQLPRAMRAEWTELALLQRQTGNTAMYVFVLAVVLVFLVLAAQYESWSLPLAVILVVPMCLLCSVVGVLIARMDINIFTQIGFVVLVGLACKNAILIVEYAKAQREAGVPLYEATLAACRLRLRPIMMTSFAFILGVVPLVLSVGAGAEMRRTLGTAVFSGMLGVTLFGIFLTPVFFFVIGWLGELRTRTRQNGDPTALEVIAAPTGITTAPAAQGPAGWPHGSDETPAG
jgi:multidrug efflux pump subunit AcrB